MNIPETWVNQLKGICNMKTEIANGKTVTGDLISLAKQGEFDIIIHGCNCFCTMGSGIAAQIRTQYPQAYQVDCTTVKGDKSKLGSFTAVEVMSEIIDPDNYIIDESGQPTYPTIKHHYFYIVNMYTQFGFNPADHPCDYDAIRKGFRKIARLDEKNPKDLKIGYPLIGAGLAGGDWDVISKIINEELKDCDHTLVKWEQE